MAKIKINTSDEPIRLFNSNFLEFFTHISPIAILIIWLSVVVFFVYRSVVMNSDLFFVFTVGIVIGLMLWILAEYVLHRFMFYFSDKNVRQERISSLFPGILHAQPKIKTRLVIPPAVSIPLTLVFVDLLCFSWQFYWVFPIGYLQSLLASSPATYL